MTANTHSDASETLEPITNIDALREDDGVSFHEKIDTAPEDVVDQMAELPDLASVGITNDDGQVLLRQLTETCSWKIPTASVAPEEDFVSAIRVQVLETLGLSVALPSIAGVWEITVRTEAGERSATRTFVVFEGTVTDDNYDLDEATPTGDPVDAADWFDELPDRADEVPGTDLFVD
jgi:hypothetical protein